MSQANMITLRHLNIFVALYENKGNMTRTAEKCYIAQPAISLALSELEDLYSCRLFDRISRKLYINDAGTRLYGYAKKVLNLLEDMGNGMKDVSSGSSLRVGSCDSMDARRLPGHVAAFTRRYPETKVRSTVEATESLIGKVLNNELDIAMIDRKPENKLLVAEKYSSAKLVLAVSPELGFKDGQRITAAELASLPLVLREKGSGIRQAFDEAMKKHGCVVEPIYEGAGNGCVVDAAAAGMGVAVMPVRMMEEYRRRGQLIHLAAEDLDLEITYYLIYHKDKGLTENADAFIALSRTAESESRAKDTIHANFAAQAQRPVQRQTLEEEIPSGTTIIIRDYFGTFASA